jgi:hypothetical protein
MDTDALLKPIEATDDPVEAWKVVVEANTAAIKEMRMDLQTCDNADKVHAIMAKAEKAMEDLSVKSQKIPQWVKDGKQPPQSDAPYGQYPIYQPLNPANPVPWPPGYDPGDNSVKKDFGKQEGAKS